MVGEEGFEDVGGIEAGAEAPALGGAVEEGREFAVADADGAAEVEVELEAGVVGGEVGVGVDAAGEGAVVVVLLLDTAGDGGGEGLLWGSAEGFLLENDFVVFEALLEEVVDFVGAEVEAMDVDGGGIEEEGGGGGGEGDAVDGVVDVREEGDGAVGEADGFDPADEVGGEDVAADPVDEDAFGVVGRVVGLLDDADDFAGEEGADVGEGGGGSGELVGFGSEREGGSREEEREEAKPGDAAGAGRHYFQSTWNGGGAPQGWTVDGQLGW